MTADMKNRILTLAAFLAVPAMLFSCVQEAERDVKFGIDSDRLEIGPDGGSSRLRLEVGGRWTAVTDQPWIRLSPSNGAGSVDCKVEIDSTVLCTSRTALLQIVADGETAPLDFTVVQEGYPKEIKVETQPETLPNYAPYGEKNVKVKITANVPFEMKINDEKPWVACKAPDFASILDRGYRPRTVELSIDWQNNPRPEDRSIDILFEPDKKEGELARHDVLTLKQTAAEQIVPGIKGDSLAILACARSLGCERAFDPSERMMHWENVVLWQATDKDLGDNTVGRVRSVRFSGNSTKEGIPFEIQYLDQAESISFYSNTNKLFLNFTTGENISKLKNLKSLQIFGFGISEVDESLADLENLEYLDLSGNNLDEIPELLLDPANFPKLTHLALNANNRYYVLDMATTTVPKEDWGGLSYYRYTDFEDKTDAVNKALDRLFRLDKLQYVRLSANYMQGNLPDMKDYVDEGRVWKAGDRYKYAYDSKTGEYIYHDIPEGMIGTPKVLPEAYYLAVNLNYFTGDIPDWMLYHPMFLWWNPYTLVFNQNQKYNNEIGEPVGFSNIPPTPEYYYEMYPEQRVIDGVEEEESVSSAAAKSPLKKFGFGEDAPTGIY